MKISWLSTTGVQRLKCFNSESLQKRVGIKGVRRRHMSDKLPAKKDPPKVDSTTFFRMTNPELFMDVKSAKTWYLVGFIWVALVVTTCIYQTKKQKNRKNRTHVNLWKIIELVSKCHQIMDLKDLQVNKSLKDKTHVHTRDSTVVGTLTKHLTNHYIPRVE